MWQPVRKKHLNQKVRTAQVKKYFSINNKKVDLIQYGHESILVIDDEKANTDVLKKMLNQLGYKVKVKNSCIETLKNFRQHYAKYNLVITSSPRLQAQ